MDTTHNPFHPGNRSLMGTLVDTLELTEFGDFMCPRSRKSRDLIAHVLQTFDGQLTYTYRHYPTRTNEQSWLAALAAEAARRQAHFWPMYTTLFRQPSISRPTLTQLARCLGLDHTQFMNDLNDRQLHASVEADCQEGFRLGVCSTPTLFLGGQRFYGKLTLSRLIPAIRSYLSRPTTAVLSKVDAANGTICWGREAWS